MDFRLTEDQRMIAATARQVGERFGTEYWRKQDEAKAFPQAFWKAVSVSSRSAESRLVCV